MSAARRRSASAAAALLAAVGLPACAASRPQQVQPSTTPVPVVAPTTAASVAPSPTAAETAAAPSTVTTAAPTTVGPRPAPAPAEDRSRPTSTLARPGREAWARVDAYLRDRLLGAGDFAFGVAVSIDGVGVHAASYGDRNSPNIVPPPPEPPSDSSGPTTTSTSTTTTEPIALEPVDANDRFRIASISKVITGTVTLQLVADGRLGLDQRVGELLGRHLGVDVAGRPPAEITVRQLLAHTAGFNEFDRTFFGRGAENCREAAIRGLTLGVQFEPGTTYNYSNMNFCLLQHLIEAVTGRPYQAVVHDRLLAPLGIDGMRLTGTFDPRPDEVVHPSFPTRNYMEVLGGAGSWVATPSEVVKIVDSLDHDKPGWHPLPRNLTALMRKQSPGIAYRSPDEVWYGLATIAYANQSWGHTGTVENTHAMVVNRPDGMTWSILVSGNYPEDTTELAEIFQDAIDQAGIDAPAPTTSTTTTTSTSTSTTVPAPRPAASATTTTG